MLESYPALNVVDIVALGLVVIGGIQGFFRGLSGELARLIGTLFAFIAGISLHGSVGIWIRENSRLTDQTAHAVAFVATVVLAVLLMLIIRLLVKRLIKVVFADGFDRSMGIIAGLARMSVIVCIIFLIMNLIPHDYLNRLFGEESAIGSVVTQYVPEVRETLERVTDGEMPTEEKEKADSP